jgi:hypothetical protein
VPLGTILADTDCGLCICCVCLVGRDVCVQATSAEISVKVKEAEETEAEIDKTREKCVGGRVARSLRSAALRLWGVVSLD